MIDAYMLVQIFITFMIYISLQMQHVTTFNAATDFSKKGAQGPISQTNFLSGLIQINSNAQSMSTQLLLHAKR